MPETETLELRPTARLILTLLRLLVVAGIVRHVVTSGTFQRIRHNLVERSEGRRSFRCILQPLMAITAIFDGFKERSPWTALVGCLVLLLPWAATAQQPASLPPQVSTPSGWVFNVAPYIWLPTVHANLEYNLPPALGGRLPTDLSSGPGDYISKLNFAAMFAAEARYDRFSVLTDFMYTNGNAGSSNIRSLNFFGLPPIPISRTLETSTSSRLSSTIWTLAAGYTVFQGDWGNFDLLAGFRYLGAHADTDYSLAFTIVGPRGNGATFGGSGGISGSRSVWNGIAGFRGRIRLPVEGLFIPYYFDIGGGGSHPTWQIASGLGYQTGWAGVSLLYRYLSFQQGSSSVVKHLDMGGPMIMVNFTF